MIATVEILKNQERSRNEYASHFLKSTDERKRLQAMLAGFLPRDEVLQLALFDRELRLQKHCTTACFDRGMISTLCPCRLT